MDRMEQSNLSWHMNQQLKYKQYRIGAYSYGAPVVEDWRVGSDDPPVQLHIGKFCSFASGVYIILVGEHRPDWVTTYPFPAFFPDAAKYVGHPASKGDIVIGHDVWVGHGAVILSGLTIGSGAVIGAGSIVTKDVEPYSIVAGNPAHFIRHRFDDECRRALMRIAWWDWPIEKIEQEWPLLLSPDIRRFIGKHDRVV